MLPLRKPNPFRFLRRPRHEKLLVIKAAIVTLRHEAERRLRYPNRSATLSRRGVVNFFRAGGIGDTLMCTPVLRALKRLHPNCRIRFYTNYPSLLRGIAYIDEVRSAAASPLTALHLEYESAVPSPKHLTRLIGDGLGLKVSDVRPDCAVDWDLVERFREKWRGFSRPHIVVNRHSNNLNKDWPEAYWTQLIRRLSRVAGVIEIGNSGTIRPEEFGPGYVDLRGGTSLDDFVAAVAAADLHIGPISGPLHIAAAVRTPSVVIVSGYEHPANTEYPGNVVLYERVECAPCWLQRPCPNGLKCLKAISVEQVESAVWALWDDTRTISKPAVWPAESALYTDANANGAR